MKQLAIKFLNAQVKTYVNLCKWFALEDRVRIKMDDHYIDVYFDDVEWVMFGDDLVYEIEVANDN